MSRIDAIKEMLKEDPQDSFLLYALALEYEKTGELQKAFDELVSLQKTQPDYLPVYYKLGKLSEQLSQIQQAVAFYRQGITVAKTQGDTKTLGELKEAFMQWEEEE